MYIYSAYEGFIQSSCIYYLYVDHKNSASSVSKVNSQTSNMTT